MKFTVDPPLAARSVVFEDSKPAGDPPRVAFTAEKTAKIIPTVKTTPTIVHNDERALGTFDKWADYVSPVLDMTPTVGAHFGNFTLTTDPFDETEDEDACECARPRTMTRLRRWCLFRSHQLRRRQHA